MSRRRTKSEPWNLTRIGSYGTFSSGNSLPIEFLQTTFAQSEIEKLSLASDVKPDKLDFEMLMQRDIDEKRASEGLGGYLNPDEDKPKIIERTSVFFPPLLIACIPCEDRTVNPFYPDEKWEEWIDEKGNGHLTRRWGDMFKYDFLTDDWVEKLEIHSPNSNNKASIDMTNVEVKFNLSQNSEPGVKLIAIDGQHRLHALQTLRRKKPDAVANLVVPVCILFSTSASLSVDKYHREKTGGGSLPNVPETFRKIFVDVNSKMVAVGAHTNILLNDTTVGSLIVREFCKIAHIEDSTLNLSAIEWNIRSPKDSTILTRGYSQTSIGIIEKALRDSFEGSEHLLPQLLDYQDVSVEEELVKAADNPETTDITWTTFSIAQRKILADRVSEGIARLIYKIFFVLPPYLKAFEKYAQELKNWETKSKGNQEDSFQYYKALDCVTNFQTAKQEDDGYQIIRKFGREHSDWRKNQLSPVMAHALFQRSMLLTLRDLMDALRDYRIQNIGEGFIVLLSRAMEFKTGLFSPIRLYTKKTIWHESGSIVARDYTRHQLSKLTLAICGGNDAAKDIAEAIDTNEENQAEIIQRLQVLGEEKASEYWDRFVIDRTNHFAKSYQFNLGLDPMEVEHLNEAKIEQDEEKLKIKKGDLEEDDAQKIFNRAVKNHLREEFIAAEEELRKVLNFETHIIRPDFFEEDSYQE